MKLGVGVAGNGGAWRRRLKCIALAIEYFHFSRGRGFHNKMIWIVGQMHFGAGQVLGFLWI